MARKRGKRWIALLLCLGLLPLGGVAVAQEEGMTDMQSFSINQTTLFFDPTTGDLTGVEMPRFGAQDTARTGFERAYVDFCLDTGDGAWEPQGAYLRGTLFYQNMDTLNTYQMPNSLEYNDQNQHPRRLPQDATLALEGDTVTARYAMEPWEGAGFTLEVETRYQVLENGVVSMEATLKNTHDEAIIINGASANVTGIAVGENTLAELPGNIPAQVYSMAGLPDYYTVKGDYASALIHFMEDQGGGDDFNVIFADAKEKWMPTFTKTGAGTVDAIHLACTIDRLQPGETLTLGTMFLQVAAPGQGYAGARGVYSLNGWEAPTDGVRGATVYSGHPAGVSDNDFQGASGTLDAYQEQLPKVKALGFDALWILPVFEHPASGGSVYLPYNMEYIDSRYSARVTGDMSLEEKRATAGAEMGDFGKAAKDAGLYLMMDYVPHGPYLYNPDSRISPDNIYDNPWITEERRAWIAQDRWWEDPNPEYTHDRDEWNCYAFDFANTDYLAYMRALAQKQSEAFHLDGSRIDAVMGSLPNWNPQGDNRISQTGLGGGVAMTGALRQGVLDAGKTPLILPENNFPTPVYAPVSDLYYDTPFYRVTLDTRKAGADEVEFAATVAHWLKTQQASAPKGQQFGRFLENHDTVAPWYADFYDGKRATAVYGLSKARALWTLLSSIDGSLIIYQNDELGNEDFFSELMAMRKAQFGQDNGLAIEYLNDAASGIVALRRYNDEGQKLVLVNLTAQEASRDFSALPIGGVRLSTAGQEIVYGGADIQGDTVTLPAYGSVVIRLEGGEAFAGENTAQQYLVTNILQQRREQQESLGEQTSAYQPLTVEIPVFAPAATSEASYDPVEQFSEETTDTPYWKYMYLDKNAGPQLSLLTHLKFDSVGVWRVGDREGNGSFCWAGVGRNNTYYPANHYFEMDTDMGGGVYGFLVFVAPKDGTYTLPAFDIIGVGEGNTTFLVVLQNGELAYVSDMLQDERDTVRTEAQVFELAAGDTLSFYVERPDGSYSYVELEGLLIDYQE